MATKARVIKAAKMMGVPRKATLLITFLLGIVTDLQADYFNYTRTPSGGTRWDNGEIPGHLLKAATLLENASRTQVATTQQIRPLLRRASYIARRMAENEHYYAVNYKEFMGVLTTLRDQAYHDADLQLYRSTTAPRPALSANLKSITRSPKYSVRQKVDKH